MRKDKKDNCHLPEEHYVGWWQRPGPGLQLKKVFDLSLNKLYAVCELFEESKFQG